MSEYKYKISREKLYALDIKQILSNRKKQSFNSYILTTTSYTFINLNKIQVLNDAFGHDKIDLLLGMVEKYIEDLVSEYYEEGVWCRYGGNEYLIFGIHSVIEDEVKRAVNKLNIEIQNYILRLIDNSTTSRKNMLCNIMKFGLTAVNLSYYDKNDTDELYNPYTNFEYIVKLLDILMYEMKSNQNSNVYFSTTLNFISELSNAFNSLEE